MSYTIFRLWVPSHNMLLQVRIWTSDPPLNTGLNKILVIFKILLQHLFIHGMSYRETFTFTNINFLLNQNAKKKLHCKRAKSKACKIICEKKKSDFLMKEIRITPFTILWLTISFHVIKIIMLIANVIRRKAINKTTC